MQVELDVAGDAGTTKPQLPPVATTPAAAAADAAASGASATGTPTGLGLDGLDPSPKMVHLLGQGLLNGGPAMGRASVPSDPYASQLSAIPESPRPGGVHGSPVQPAAAAGSSNERL